MDTIRLRLENLMPVEQHPILMSLGASFYTTIQNGIETRGQGCLHSFQHIDRFPTISRKFMFSEVLGYMRHYLKVLGIYQLADISGYNTYEEAVNLSSLTHTSKEIIFNAPLVYPYYCDAKGARDTQTVSEQLKVVLNGLETMTKNPPQKDILVGVPQDVWSAIHDFGVTREEKLVEITSWMFTGLTPTRIIEINEIIAEESQRRYIERLR